MKKKSAEFIQWMGPILDSLRSLGGSGKPREVSDFIADKLKVRDDKLEETLKSGAPRFHNQVAWARQYLVWEGLLDSSTRGVWSLTKKGYKTNLSDEETREIFLKWVKVHADRRRSKSEGARKNEEEQILGEEDVGYSSLLLEKLYSLSPKGFEELSARLLREHEFEKVEVTGKPGDGGIDGMGILRINPFVSFKVIFQCKRYRGTVQRKEIAEFRNSMLGRADKGIMITTGTFSRQAVEEAQRDGAPPIELVDGEGLVRMFENLELGLLPKKDFDIDHIFFEPYMPGKE